MIKKLPLLVFAFVICTIASIEAQSKKTWFKSATGDGYMAIEVSEKNGKPVLTTTVNSYFGNEKLNFISATTCDTEKLANASKIQFNGTIDASMRPVVYNGTRIRTKKNASYWSFNGDFKNEITNDPEVNQFLTPKHTAMLRIPSETIPSFNVMAIVTKLPFSKEEGTFKFNSLDETKLFVRKNQTIDYVGEEVANVKGEEQTVHKFAHKGKKMKPAYYWVNNSRELVKIMFDNEFEFVASSETEAKGNMVADLDED